MSTVLIQFHEENQYPIHGKNLKRRNFSWFIKGCDKDVELTIKEFRSHFNIKADVVIRFRLQVFLVIFRDSHDI